MTRNAQCSDCGETFIVEKIKGRLPARCQVCRRKFAADRQRRWRSENPEQSREIYARSNIKRLADPAHRREKRERELRRMYGLEPEDLQRLLESQGGKCAICGYEPPLGDDSLPLPRGVASARLHVDHCHTNGHVRGLLCGKCNTMIGLANEDPAVLLAAIEYLKKD